MRILAVALVAMVVSGRVMAATPDDARSYIQALDTAIKASEPALATGNLATIAAHSRRMNALAKDGERFGSTAFSEPYGYCFSAGIIAKDWWHQTLDVARSGKENLPGSLARAAEQYRDHRGACMEAADKESRKKN